MNFANSHNHELRELAKFHLFFQFLFLSLGHDSTKLGMISLWRFSFKFLREKERKRFGLQAELERKMLKMKFFFFCVRKENAILLNETDPKINKISSFQMSPFKGIAKGQFISKANGEVDSVCGLLCFPISSAKEVINAQWLLCYLTHPLRMILVFAFSIFDHSLAVNALFSLARISFHAFSSGLSFFSYEERQRDFLWSKQGI